MNKWIKVVLIMAGMIVFLLITQGIDKLEEKMKNENQTSVTQSQSQQEGANSDSEKKNDSKEEKKSPKIRIGTSNIIALAICGAILGGIKYKEYKNTKQKETEE